MVSEMESDMGFRKECNERDESASQIQEHESQHQDQEAPSIDDQSPADQSSIFLGNMVRFINLNTNKVKCSKKIFITSNLLKLF